MLDNNLPVTLQFQLRSKLIERIERGDWKPGAKILSEREICEKYGVSRMTVREVIGDLEREGILTRKQGKGTFVNKSTSDSKPNGVFCFSEELKKAGILTTTRILSYDIVPCASRESSKLGISTGERVYRIEQLRFIEGSLFSLEYSYIPVSVASGMTEQSVKEQDITQALEAHSGLVADSADEIFEAIPCPDKPAMMIGVKRDAPVLRVSRLSRADGKSLEYRESLIRGDKYKYIITFK